VQTKMNATEIHHIFTGAQAREQLEKTVDWMKENHIASREERMAAIGHLIDSYIAQTGERPDPAQLERLTDMILHEEIKDPNPYKVQHNEYPIFSERQLMLREGREVPLKAAATVGTDGRDHRKPIRRKRSTYEMIKVDEKAKIRNKERRERYRKATRPGPVVTYFIEKMQ
jgi:hypothetical protein